MAHRNRINEPEVQSEVDTRADAQQHVEGPVARAIEHQTAKLPSDTFLWAAAGAALGALGLMLSGRKHAGLLVGQWVAPILIAGLYNKIVKTEGHDRSQRLHEHALEHDGKLIGGLEPASARTV